MVKDDLRSLMIWVIVVVVVLQAMQCNLSDILWSRNKADIASKQQYYRETLTEAEVDEFMRYWPQYNKLNLQVLENSSLSVDKEIQIDWKAKIWFVYHKLDAERFMYVRLRLKELLKELEEKRQALAVAEQLASAHDELSKEMREKHVRYANAIHLNAQETEIINQREEELKQLFRIYP